MKRAKAILKVEVEFFLDDYDVPSEAAYKAFINGETWDEVVLDVETIEINGEDDPMRAVRRD